MKIPKKIKIAGHWYSVIFPYIFTESNTLYGLCDNTSHKIMLSEKRDGIQRARSHIEETFLHELIHAVDYNYNTSSTDGGLTEFQIEKLGVGLYQVLADAGFLKP